MKLLCVVLVLVIIALIIGILYLNSYNKLIVTKIKMDNAHKNITNDLNEKYNLMNKLYIQIKKVVKKKDYLKEFAALNTKKVNNYQLDSELNNHLETMLAFKEDYKELNTDEFNNILNEIKELNQKILANKKFFNKQNNYLIKTLKGYNKYVAKINHINIKNSYEIKEPVID